MAPQLTSERHQADDLAQAMELPYDLGWSDGLPVCPPTESAVSAFLDAARMEADQVVTVIAEREKTITAEKMAINAVMAGCKPEYAPVLAAALEAMGDARYRFNHLASLGSPWPIVIVNGPYAKKIGLYSGMYLFGPGNRANLTIARGLSLVLRNCAGAKSEDIQRGQWGNAMRFMGCIAENEETGWEPLHVQRGFKKEDSTVTVASTYPGSPCHVTVNLNGEKPTRMLDAACHAITNWGGAQWTRGTYTLLIGPHMVEIFRREGWSKKDVRDYVVENTTATIADLKYRGAWGKFMASATEETLRIEPGDEQKRLYLFKENPEYDKYLFLHSALEDRDLDVMVVVAGGDAGARMQIVIPYQVSTNSVTKRIRIPS
ncbi:MAG: hypothetical protein KGJ98_00180 [Chloroflexota bacterium]|nr:hypothetical protein [Chloroflexota bacterium]